MPDMSFTWLLIRPTRMKIPVDSHPSPHYRPSSRKSHSRTDSRRPRKSPRTTPPPPPPPRRTPPPIGPKPKWCCWWPYWRDMGVISRWSPPRWARPGTRSSASSKFYRRSAHIWLMLSSRGNAQSWRGRWRRTISWISERWLVDTAWCSYSIPTITPTPKIQQKITE